jgi:hypothetical protein
MPAEEEENMREAMEEHLMNPVNPEEPAVEEVFYEKERECAEPTNFTLSELTPELIKINTNTGKSDPHTSHVTIYTTYRNRFQPEQEEEGYRDIIFLSIIDSFSSRDMQKASRSLLKLQN